MSTPNQHNRDIAPTSDACIADKPGLQTMLNGRSLTKSSNKVSPSLAQQTHNREDLIDCLHKHLMLTFHRFFCKSGSAVPAAHAEDQQQIIRAKWFHRAQFLACQTPSKAAFFQVWCHSCRFRKLKRQQQQYSRDVQKQKLADLMTDASHAAARHDSFAVYQAVRCTCLTDGSHGNDQSLYPRHLASCQIT